METDWERDESRSFSAFNKLPDRSPFLTSRVSTRNEPMCPLATDSLSFNLNRRSVYSICPRYHNNWITTLSRYEISETSPIYDDVSHYQSTQTLAFRKHSFFLPDDESRLLSKPPECLCAVIMANVLVHIGDVSHVKPLSKYMLRVKVNFILEQATNVQRGSRGIALLFL